MPRADHRNPVTALLVCCGLFASIVLGGCTPKVEVVAPAEPVTINLNVKIEHEIRVKVEQDLEELFSEDSDLF